MNTKKKIFFSVLILCLVVLTTACSHQKSSATSETKTENKGDKKITTSKTKNKETNDKTTSNPTILSDLKDSDKKTLKYYALGDSLSVGLFSDSKESRFTSLFTEELRKGTGKQVIEDNNSLSGKTVTNFGLPVVRYLINAKPDLVTIEFGTNDAAYGVDQQNLGNFVTNLDKLVGRVKSQTDAKILLMTTWSPSDGQFMENDAVYDQKIKEIGKKYGVPVVDLSTIWQNNPSVTQNDTGYSEVYSIQKDEFHPNQLGHQKIAELLYKTIQSKEMK